MLNALSVDVEDYFQVSAFERLVPRDRWSEYPSRVVDNTRRVLALLARYDVRATFFVLGWVARHYPALVREIDQAGHEIGSHSYWHRLVYELSPEQFVADLRASRSAIEDALGRSIDSYRAPSFSITRRSLWALGLLAREGFTIDSSIYAVRHDRYGIPGAQPRLHRLATDHGPLWELPPSVCRVAGMNLPVSGGGYFRLYPWKATEAALDHLNRRCRQPFVFYIHPWEFDPLQPRIGGASLAARFRHYVNLSSTVRKFERLLGRFRFAPVGDVIRAAVGDGAGDDGFPAVRPHGAMPPVLERA